MNYSANRVVVAILLVILLSLIAGLAVNGLRYYMLTGVLGFDERAFVRFFCISLVLLFSSVFLMLVQENKFALGKANSFLIAFVVVFLCVLFLNISNGILVRNEVSIAFVDVILSFWISLVVNSLAYLVRVVSKV